MEFVIFQMVTRRVGFIANESFEMILFPVAQMKLITAVLDHRMGVRQYMVVAECDGNGVW